MGEIEMRKVGLGLVVVLMMAITARAETTQTAADDGFGDHKIYIMVAQPTFSAVGDGYRRLYGDASFAPAFGYAASVVNLGVATVGWGFRLSYYTASGSTAQPGAGGGQPEPGQATKTDTGAAQFTMLPLDIFAEAQTMVLGKFLVADGRLGLQPMYWQEVRSISVDDGVDAEESQDTAAPTNKGANYSLSLGLGLHVHMNALDERAVRSLEDSMGYKDVYASLFVDYSQRLAGDGPDLSRLGIGLGFTFGSI